MEPNSAAHQRYQFKPFVGSSHSWALEILEKQPKNMSLLDIGCGSGAIGKELGKLGYKNLYAVEVDNAARQSVQGFYQRVEDSTQAYSEMRFDVILLLDVLEHIANPAKFLQKNLELLNTGGIILISMPNIAHWSVRLPLLFGFFDYQERGILDKTHLQFFTRKRVRSFLKEQTNLKKERLDSSIEPLEFILPEKMWDNKMFPEISRFRLWLAQVLPGFFAYQHLILAKKI